MWRLLRPSVAGRSHSPPFAEAKNHRAHAGREHDSHGAVHFHKKLMIPSGTKGVMSDGFHRSPVHHASLVSPQPELSHDSTRTSQPLFFLNTLVPILSLLNSFHQSLLLFLACLKLAFAQTDHFEPSRTAPGMFNVPQEWHCDPDTTRHRSIPVGQPTFITGFVCGNARHDHHTVGTNERATPLAPRQAGVELIAKRAVS